MKDLTPLKLSEITPEVFVIREEICSMEYEPKAYDYFNRATGGGTILTLTNGRKIYVKGMNPAQILEKLNGL